MQIWQLLISIIWISSTKEWMAWVDWLPYICLLFWSFSNVYHSACVWPTALKLGCITNLNMLFHVMRFISLVDEIQFMLISSRHICIRSICGIFMFGQVWKHKIIIAAQVVLRIMLINTQIIVWNCSKAIFSYVLYQYVYQWCFLQQKNTVLISDWLPAIINEAEVSWSQATQTLVHSFSCLLI